LDQGVFSSGLFSEQDEDSQVSRLKAADIYICIACGAAMVREQYFVPSIKISRRMTDDSLR
jgi:hypothetical protein